MGKGTLTDLQLAVMTALWHVGEGTTGDILAAMNEGKVLAPTTVATMLQRLTTQGWVKHRRRGRQLVYRANVTQKDAATGVLRRVLSSFFGGRVSALTAQLLATEDLSREDLEQLRQLLHEKRG